MVSKNAYHPVSNTEVLLEVPAGESEVMATQRPWLKFILDRWNQGQVMASLSTHTKVSGLCGEDTIICSSS